MQFVTVLEYNHKENEATLHYCQWDGNAEELEKLFAIIERAQEAGEFGEYGDVSTFECSRELIPEAAVDAHVRLRYGIFTHMFQKHVGTFNCPPFTTPVLNEERDAYVDGPMTDPMACAKELDTLFYAARLGGYFKA